MGIDTRNTSVIYLLEKIEHFLRLVALNMLIYVNLCKFMQIRWVCKILKSTKTKSTECQPGWKHKNDMSKRPNLCRNDSYIFGQKHVSVSKWHCVEIVCVEVTGTLVYYNKYDYKRDEYEQFCST